MKILLTFDENYACHAAVVMESAVRNCPQKLGFAIIHYDISEATQALLHRHFDGRVDSLDFYKVEKALLLDTVKNVNSQHWGLPTWLRLFAPNVLPQTDNYVIYLDCDTIVCDNILKMADGADLTKPLCAVSHYNPGYKWGSLTPSPHKPYENIAVFEASYYRIYKNLGMRENAGYFCAGTMIINLDYWRKHRVGEQALDFANKYPERIFVVDQDALNHVINGNYCELPPRWDTMCALTVSGYSPEELQDAVKNPAIIHDKGWSGSAPAHVRRLYYKYRRLTPYPYRYKRSALWVAKKCYRGVVLPLVKLLLRPGKYEIVLSRQIGGGLLSIEKCDIT